jgi:lipoprotein-releasing system ATP-binding protein
MMPVWAISARQLTKRYRSGEKEITVFAGLDLDIGRGSAVAIVGESGAGKSTLLHLLGGLDRPTSGQVFFGDTDVFSLSDEDRARFRNRSLGFVWQQNSLLPEFTAAENVAMPLLIAGAPRKDALRTAGERLHEVGLADRGHHRAGEMSGGEQQRAALARALVHDPEVLLADEPTGNLDHRTAEGVVELLERLRESRNLTTVTVTHSLELAARCPHVIRLEKGNVLGPAAATAPGLSGAPQI